MKTLLRREAREYWNQYWSDMKEEWFKAEVLQDYTGEDDCPSLRAWLAGDKQTSLRLLKADTRDWGEQLKHKHDQKVQLRRVRIITEPYTPYTLWEIECYKHNNIPNGEQVLIVDGQDTKDLDLPNGDLMLFDNKYAAICAYDSTGRLTQQIFYDNHDNIARFLQLKRDLLTLASPL